MGKITCNQKQLINDLHIPSLKFVPTFFLDFKKKKKPIEKSTVVFSFHGKSLQNFQIHRLTEVAEL